MSSTLSIHNNVYHPAQIEESAIAEHFKMTFHEILCKDYKDKTFGFEQRILDIKCIDLDSYEHSNGGTIDCTMDCAIGIASFDATRRAFSSHKTLLIELKLDCESKQERVTRSDLSQKVLHSRDLLISLNHSLDSTSIFIFPKNLKSLYERRLKTWSNSNGGSICKDWIILNPGDFNSYIGFQNDYPYLPINNEETIKKGILDAFGKDVYDFIDRVSEWHGEAMRYKRKYNIDEYNHIMTALSNIVPPVLANVNDTEALEYIKYEESFNKIIDFSKNF